MTTQRLEVKLGFQSVAGKRTSNDDFVVSYNGHGNALADCIAVIADGTGGSPGGRMAAEISTLGFLDAFLHQPQTLGVERAAAKSLQSVNAWLNAQGRSGHHREGLVTTFSALILRGREAHIVHVGDSRIYRLRGEKLERLTEDHTHPHPDLHHVLVRAVGLESQMRADYRRHFLEPHDRFILCSDGVHAYMGEAKLRQFLAARSAPQEGSERIVEAALAAGGQDNATAMVVDIVELPPAQRHEIETTLSDLPIGELPKTDEVIDNYKLLKVISDGQYSRLFLALDLQNGDREVILKFPHPRVAQAQTYRNAFARESWVASQVKSPFVTEVIEPETGRRTRLYVVMPYYRGETLEQRLKRAPSMSLNEGVDIATKLCKAVYALNRRRIIHRDIKPDNVLLEQGGKGYQGLRLVDLGVAHLPGLNMTDDTVPGTPSYMAPELFHNAIGNEYSEVYAIGATLFRMWSGGEYPFGEIEPFSSPRFARRNALAKYRPDLPAWLDQVLSRATSTDPTMRYADAMELAFELENNAVKGGQQVALKIPLLERRPVLVWQVISLTLLIALLATLYFR